MDIVISVLTSDAFWIMVGSFGAIAALTLTYRQIKKTDSISSADFLLKLVDRFDSDDMLKKRQKIMEIRNKDPNDFEMIDNYKQVFDFFENLGLLLRKKIIPKELIWIDFNYWIQGYWTAFKNFFEAGQRKRPSFYCEFQYLFEEILAYDDLKLNNSILPFFLRKGKPIEMSRDELEVFADLELNLESPKPRPSIPACQAVNVQTSTPSIPIEEKRSEGEKLKLDEVHRIEDSATQTRFNSSVLFLAFIAGLVGLLAIASPFHQGLTWEAFHISLTIIYVFLVVGLSASFFSLCKTTYLIDKLILENEPFAVQNFLKEYWRVRYMWLIKTKKGGFRASVFAYTVLIGVLWLILLILRLFPLKTILELL